MKILILGFTKVKYMPYLNFYIDNIDMSKHEIDLLYWNRDLQNENLSHLSNVTIDEFLCYQEDETSKLFKIKSFLKYRKYIVKKLKKEEYDFIIILHSLTGLIIYDKLKKYKNSYILDYRDSTYEKFKIFRWMIGKLVKNSYVTFVSSDGFRKFLPQKSKNKIFTSHNLLFDSLKHCYDKEKYGIKSNKLRIGFWGFIREEQLNIEIIKKISIDNRLELHYYGREQQTALNLKAYVKNKNIKNVFFHGEYRPEDRYKFILQTDIIHNIYCNNNAMLAMGNKYYDGVIFRIPQLCMKDSFMGKNITENGLGLEINPYVETFVEDILEYYSNIEIEVFNQKCDEVLNKILNETKRGSCLINNV